MLPPLILAPTPRRATSSSILDSDSDPSDHERYDSRKPLPNTPLQTSTPSVLNQQLPLNGVPNMRASGGGNAQTPRHGHSRVSSWGSARSSVSPSLKKSARFSPNLTTDPPQKMHNPPPPGATPIRSALRQTPSPGTFLQHQLPTTHANFTPDITVLNPTPPHQTLLNFGAPNWQTNAGGNGSDDSDGGTTPGQRLFRSRSHRSGSPPDDRRGTRSSDEGGRFDHSALADNHARIPTGWFQHQPHDGTSDTSPQHNRSGATRSADQSQQDASSRGDDQQRSGGTKFHTSWQAPRSIPTCPPVVPCDPCPPTDPSLDPSGSRQSRQAGRATNTDLPPINTSSCYPTGAQLNGGPRSSQTRHSPRATPYGPARSAFTPANGNGRANVNVNSVINELLRVQPTSVAWQTHGGVLTWTPHPALPDFGQNLLGGPGSGNGYGGRVGNADWFTGGYPFPGANPTWTPGVWPPTGTSTPGASSGGALVRLAPWIIPNPCNAAMPHIIWDISQLPTTANRITGNHVIVNMMERLDDVATYPAVDRLEVVCQVGVAEKFWGHIRVKSSKPKGVTVWDVFNGIYEYFQKRVGRRELDRMKELLGDERLEEKMADAFYQRVRVTPALPGYELKEGLKRVDCLGDRCLFWGLYVSYNEDGSWQLNLGLVNRRRCA